MEEVSTFIATKQDVPFTGQWMLVADWSGVSSFRGSPATVSYNNYHFKFVVLYLLFSECNYYLRQTPFKDWLSQTDLSPTLYSRTSVVCWSGLGMP